MCNPCRYPRVVPDVEGHWRIERMNSLPEAEYEVAQYKGHVRSKNIHHFPPIAQPAQALHTPLHYVLSRTSPLPLLRSLFLTGTSDETSILKWPRHHVQLPRPGLHQRQWHILRLRDQQRSPKRATRDIARLFRLERDG